MTLKQHHLDVRPLIEAGKEPFEAVMAARRMLKPGDSLHLVAPFEPFPLYEIFAADGYGVKTEHRGPGEWHILFEPTAAADAEANADNSNELDLRELEPPLPLQRAAEAIGRLGIAETLTLHTRFRPVHLFEALDADAFDYESEETAANHWISHIWRISQNN